MDIRLKRLILEHYHSHFTQKPFIPGQTRLATSAKVFTGDELLNGVQAVLDGWWTEGHFTDEFEQLFCDFLGIRYTTLTNSGSSANLLALSALTSSQLGKRRLRPGDEVITVAAAFPTTVNPIFIQQCIPVFIDVEPGTYNTTADRIRQALSPKTKAIMMAHSLGNPFPLHDVVEICKTHGLWLIEDACDALGSRYAGKYVSTFGDIGTFSFYPAHHITMGEGGAVVTNNPLLYRAIRQFRDWGRDCWCETGKDNTCGKRFGWQMGDLPFGYDHKFIYSQIGYNLKLTDVQAALGVAQMKKLPDFIKQRKINFSILFDFFQQYKKFFILPSWDKESDPSWFGFMLLVQDDAPFTKHDLVTHLEKNEIATRPLFSGNLVKHPAYASVPYRISGSLENSDRIMRNGFWVGLYPGLTDEMLDYMKTVFRLFIEQFV